MTFFVSVVALFFGGRRISLIDRMPPGFSLAHLVGKLQRALPGWIPAVLLAAALARGVIACRTAAKS